MLMPVSMLHLSHKGLAMALLGDWLLVVEAGTERVPASLSMGSFTSC